MTTRIPLTALPRALAAFAGQQSPSYRRLYALTLDGRIPAAQENGRWFVSKDDLPSIAATLGLAAERVAA